MADKTFIKITNKDIYNKIVEFEKVNEESHREIMKHQMRTNGRVTLNRWIATTALSISFIIAGWFGRHFIV